MAYEDREAGHPGARGRAPGLIALGVLLIAVACSALTSLVLYELALAGQPFVEATGWMLGASREHRTTYLTSLSLAAVAVGLSMPALLAVGRAIADSSRGLARLGLAATTVGLIGSAATLGFLFYLALVLAPGFWSGDPLQILDRLRLLNRLESWYLLALVVALTGLTVGLAALSAAAMRSRFGSWWPAAVVAVLIVAAGTVHPYGTGVLGIALAGLGAALLVRGRRST